MRSSILYFLNTFSNPSNSISEDIWVTLRTIKSMNFSRPNTGVSKPFPSPNPRIEPRSPTCRHILYQLSHKGSPRILEWVAYPFSLYLPDSVIELRSPALQEDSLPIELSGKPSSLSASVISQVFFGTTTLNSICSSFLCN